MHCIGELEFEVHCLSFHLFQSWHDYKMTDIPEDKKNGALSNFFSYFDRSAILTVLMSNFFMKILDYMNDLECIQ